MKLNHLAQIAFDHMWLLLFGGEEVIDLHYSVKELEVLSLALAEFTPEERGILAEVAQSVKGRLLAEPDEYGYTPRALVTDQQRHFLDAVIDKGIYDNDWWTS